MKRSRRAAEPKPRRATGRDASRSGGRLWIVGRRVGVALLGSLAVAGWLFAPRHPCEVAVFQSSYLLLEAALVLLYLLGAVLTTSFLVERERRQALAALAVLLAVGGLGLLQSRYTSVGIFVLGGDDYWVDRAVRAADRDEKICALRVALQGTQYALNLVENELVDDYADSPEVRSELFEILASIAPNDNWQSIYETRRDEALEAIAARHGVASSDALDAVD